MAAKGEDPVHRRCLRQRLPADFVGDGEVEKWIKTLDAASKLGARVICPGHASGGAADVLEDQQLFFQQLSDRVGALVRAKKSAEEVRASIERIRGELNSQARIARYVGSGLAAQVEKVYQEMTGRAFPDNVKASKTARALHAHAHSVQHV